MDELKSRLEEVLAVVTLGLPAAAAAANLSQASLATAMPSVPLVAPQWGGGQEGDFTPPSRRLPGWPSTASSIFSSSSTSPSTGFCFGASSASAAATNTAPMSVNSSSGPSSCSFFSFTTASAPVSSSSSLSTNQPVFGNPFGGSASGNNDQMNAEDSMAEDPVQSSAASVPVFGQPSVSPSPPSFAFGSTAPSQPNAFMFCGQQSQVTPQSPSPFQASGSLGGSFSLGSGGGGYKSGRRIVKVNRNKNKKKV